MPDNAQPNAIATSAADATAAPQAPQPPAVTIPESTPLADRMAAANAILEATDGGEAAPAGPAAKPTPTADGDATIGKSADSPKADPAPEGGDAPPPDAKPDSPEAKIHEQQRAIQAEAAYIRRQRQTLQDQARELEKARTTIAEQMREAQELSVMLKGDPVGAVARLAGKTGMKPQEFLQRAIERLAGDAPTDGGGSEAAEEIRRMREEMRQERETIKREREQAAWTQHAAREKASHVERLAGVYKANAAQYAPLGELTEGALKSTFEEAVDYCFANGIEASAFDVLQILSNNEKRASDRRRSSARDPGNPGAAAQKPEATGNGGTGSVQPGAAAQKNDGAKPRTVTQRDAAQSSGARRDLTMQERLYEADAILRGEA